MLISILLLATSLQTGEIVRSDRNSQEYYPSYSYDQSCDESQKITILHAQDAHIQSMGRSTYELTLYKVSRRVTTITDLTSSTGGQVSTTEFMRTLDQNASSLTNATIIPLCLADQYGEPSFTATLSKPEYQKKHDRLIFTLEVESYREKVPTGDLGETTIYFN